MTKLTIIALIAAISQAHAADYRAVLECRNSNATFLLYNCAEQNSCMSAAGDYVDEEKEEGNYLCHGNQWEVNVSRH